MSHIKTIHFFEDEFMKYDEVFLDILLIDRTTHRNIICGTSDYESLGEEYCAQFPITINLITGSNKNLIQPRIFKEKNNQTNRTKDKAEVFTPSWMCNEQNNLIDKSWFGRDGVFNTQEKKKHGFLQINLWSLKISQEKDGRTMLTQSALR